jgi:hypothetical protein
LHSEPVHPWRGMDSQQDMPKYQQHPTIIAKSVLI